MRPPAGVKPLAAPVGLEDAAAEPLALAKPVWTLLVVMVEDAPAAADVALPVVFWVA
jgi:hypothetical protein